jgi:hypothetical protein
MFYFFLFFFFYKLCLKPTYFKLSQLLELLEQDIEFTQTCTHKSDNYLIRELLCRYEPIDIELSFLPNQPEEKGTRSGIHFQYAD